MEFLPNIPYFNTTVNDVERVEEFRHMVLALKPCWTFSIMDIRVHKNLLGGQAALLRSAHADQEIVVVLVYGDHRCFELNHETNLRCLKFFTVSGQPPEVIGSFNNGYIFCFYKPEMLPANPQMVQLVMHALAARKIALIHKIKAAWVPQRGITLFSVLQEFVGTIESGYCSNEDKLILENFRVREAVNDLPRLQRALQYLQSPMVVTAAELCLSNKTYDPATDSVSAIFLTENDFAHQAFDIASFIAQCIKPMPLEHPKEYELAWIRAYLLEYKGETGFTEHDCICLAQAIDFHLVLIYLYWGLCNLIQAQSSPAYRPHFLSQAQMNFANYFKAREEIMFY